MINKKRAKKMTDTINTKLTLGTRWRIFWFIHWWISSKIKDAINAGQYETFVYLDEFNEVAQNKIIDFLLDKDYEIHLSMISVPKITISWR